MTTCTTVPLAREVRRCRACGGPKMEPVFSLGELRLSNFLAPGDPDTPLAPLELVGCADCMLLQLRHTVQADMLYRRFWYRSSVSATMRTALQDIVTATGFFVGFGPGDVVCDIGSNTGDLLRGWPRHLTRIGFDPAENLAAEAREGGNVIVPDYFSATTFWRAVRRPAKVITAVAMFYDLQAPSEFLRDVRSCLAYDGVFVVQLASLKQMLATNDLGNIVHEHLCYYSVTTLCRLLENHGLYPFHAEENDVNGGSMRIFAAPSHRGRSKGLEAMLAADAGHRVNDPDRWTSFWTTAKIHAACVRGLVKAAAKRGPVYVLGASTKGQTLLQFWGLTSEHLTGASERDPAKHGLEMSAGRIPIVSEEEARAKARTFLVLPWHFRKEILERERDWLAGGGRMIFPCPVPQEVVAEPPEW